MVAQKERDAPRGPARESQSGEDGLRPCSAQQGCEADREVCGERGDHVRHVRANAGREPLHEASAEKEREALGGPRAAEQHLQLGTDAFACERAEGVPRARQRSLELRIGCEAERRNQARRAKRSQRIFCEAVGSAADRAEAAGGEVVTTVRRVDDRSGPRIERDRIDGEVAVREIGRETRARAVGGDVDHAGLGRDRHRSVSDARGDGAHEEREDLLGRRRGCEIEVAHRLTAQRVANAATDEEGLVPGGVELGREGEDGGRELEGRELVGEREIEKGHRRECTGLGRSAATRGARYKADMDSICFRAPGSRLSLAALLARAVPHASEAALARVVRGGGVRVAGKVERDPACSVSPGARVVAVGMASKSAGPRLESRVLLRGPDFVVVETRPGAVSGAESTLDLRAEQLLPVIEGDAGGRSLSLFARDASARVRLLAALARGGTREERALVDAPAWRKGTLAAGVRETGHLGFQVVAERDGVAEVTLFAAALAADAVRGMLAGAGAAILGDARFGGRLVAGGLRLWSVRLQIPDEGIDLQCEAPEHGWPEEPVFPPQARGGQRASDAASLVVSRATLRALVRGHPWVLTDRETGDAASFRAGSLVVLRGPGGEPGGFARAEGDGPVAARVWSRGDAPGASVEARVAAALARRRRLLDAADGDEGTNAFRLVHGEADGLPGLAIDRLGACLRVIVTGRACAQITDRAIDATLHALGAALGTEPCVIEVMHLRARPAGTLECVRLARGALVSGEGRGGAGIVVRERGLLFEVEPGLSRPAHPSPGIGLYIDQRENRERLARRARAGRWLNLFAHTGAFSAALLAAGAAEVVSVDLSAAWLRAIDATLARNRLDATRHRAVRGDSRRHLERLDEGDLFDGIVLDPPTAAAAGRRFWSARRDLEPLVESALGHLAPGGSLLVCRNERAGPRALADLVQRAATRAEVELVDVSPAPPGEDFPPLAGFPEGDPFEGILAVRSS